MAKSVLYIDVDDTLLAEKAPGPGMSLRPGVVTQLTSLSRLFNCYWLTHWPHKELNAMWNSMYAHTLTTQIRYCDWKATDESSKAPAVVKGSPDFYWLEDTLSTGSMQVLESAGLMDRYIPVEAKGMFGFTRGVQILFAKAGITDKDLKRVGADPQWFREPLTKDYYDWNYY